MAQSKPESAGLNVNLGVSLNPQPTNRKVNVPVSIDMYSILVNATYRHLATSFPSFRRMIDRDAFLRVNLSILAKRVSWVREKTYGIRDTARCNLTTNVPISLAIFPTLYSVGKVDVKSKGISYIPSFQGLEPYANVTLEDYDAYTSAMSSIRGRHNVHDTMPSQAEGTFAYLLPVRLSSDSSVAEVWSDTSEPSSDDAVLAAVVWRSALVAGQVYGFTYGVVTEPDQLLLTMIKANTKLGFVGSDIEEETPAEAEGTE